MVRMVRMVRSLADRTFQLTCRSFATRLFNYWGVGDPVLNNGVLVLVVPGQRRVEVEIGTGLDASFNRDEWLQGVTDAMSQRFRLS